MRPGILVLWFILLLHGCTVEDSPMEYKKRGRRAAEYIVMIALVLENPRDGEPGGLLSVGSHRVRHD